MVCWMISDQYHGLSWGVGTASIRYTCIILISFTSTPIRRIRHSSFDRGGGYLSMRLALLQLAVFLGTSFVMSKC